MKRKIVSILMVLVCLSVFAEKWQIDESDYEGGYKLYRIIEAPEKYSSLLNSPVFAFNDTYRYQNLFSVPCKERMLKYLEEEKFQVITSDGVSYPFLPIEFTQVNFKLSKEELSYIWDIWKKRYAGFSKMKKMGLKEKDFLKIKDSDKLFEVLDKYIDDGHFYLQVKDRFFRIKMNVDEGCSPSIDPSGTYYESETSNAYYVRFTDCTSEKYMSELETIADRCMEKDFLILDARTNSGGSDIPQRTLRNSLMRKKYKGTVIILQDNWSYSSGEVWHVFGPRDCKLNCKLVGTHSGGMQNYGNCENFSNTDLKIMAYFGYTDFTSGLPSNYLGDGKGYEPDIWATKENMQSILEEHFAIDLSGINFQ